MIGTFGLIELSPLELPLIGAGAANRLATTVLPETKSKVRRRVFALRRTKLNKPS
jgi:hypothetical protein